MPNLSPEKLLEKLAKGKPVGAIVLEGSDDRCRDHGSETVWIRHIAYRDATDAVMAMDEASCAVVNKFFHSSEAPMIF